MAGPLCVLLYTARDVGALELSLDPKSKHSRVDNSPQQGPLKGPKQERVIVIKTNFQVSKYPGLREFINFKPTEHDLESLFELLSNKFELIWVCRLDWSLFSFNSFTEHFYVLIYIKWSTTAFWTKQKTEDLFELVDPLIRSKCRSYLQCISTFLYLVKNPPKLKEYQKIAFLNTFLTPSVQSAPSIPYCVLFSFCAASTKSKHPFPFSVCFIPGTEYLRANISLVFDKCNFLNEFWKKKTSELKRAFRCLFHHWTKTPIYLEVINYKLWI